MNKKNNVRLLFIILALFSIPSFFSCTTTTPTIHSGLCADWAEFKVGELIVQNNVWNKGTRTDFEQCIYKSDSGSDYPFGWTWKWPSRDGSVYAYPEIIYGYKPWSSSSTTPNLPVQLSANKNITVSYTLTQQVQGTFNRSFDIWLTSINPPTPTTIAHEIMIWLDHSVITPAGAYQKTVSINGEDYAYYKGAVNTGSWTYIAFVKTSPELSGDTKVDAFFDFLMSENAVQASEFCAAIEFGNEVVAGTGKTEFSNYSITVKEGS